MEGTLKVTPQELKTAASDFSTKAGQVKTLHDEMISKIDSLGGSWTGSASDAYKAKFKALQDSMYTINRMINEHVNDLNTMAEQYDAAESQAQSAAESLSASTLA